MTHFRKLIVSMACLQAMATTFGLSPLLAQANTGPPLPEWIRGEGESLEIRICGRLIRRDQKAVEHASMAVVMAHNNLKKVSTVKVMGDSYEVWLPVGAMVECYYIRFSAAADGVRAETGIFRNQIRQLAIDGYDIELKPLRTVSIEVSLDDAPVPDATVLANILWGGSVSEKTDATGIARLDVPEDATLTGLLAWKEGSPERLLGGFDFYGNSKLDRASNQQKIKLNRCETRRIIVIDQNERPIAHLPFTLSISMPEPNRTYFNLPEDVNLQTDKNGECTLDWLPKIAGVGLEHFSQDERFTKENKLKTDMQARRLTLHVANRNRQRITGKVEFKEESALSLGGFAVELSGNDVVKMRGHSAYAFTNADGTFTADVIPNANYGYWVEDETWVSADANGVPADSDSDEVEPLAIELSRGYPVKVSVLSETSNEPIASVDVSLFSQRSYTTSKDGVTKHYSAGPRVRRSTDQSGTIKAVAPAGKLEVSAFTNDWRDEKEIEIVAGKTNEITLYKKTTRAKFTGQLKTWNDQEIDFQRCKINVESIDGTSNEEFTLNANERGAFHFQTGAEKIGVIVFSEDRKLAGSALIDSPEEPLEIKLYPTQAYSGQILDFRNEPMEDHRVFAWIEVVGDRKRMRVSVNSKTDAEGNFTFEHLPCKTLVRVGTDLYIHDSSDFETVEKLVIEPDDPARPRMIKKLKPPKEEALSEIAQKYARIRSDCRLAGYHLLVTVSDTADFELQRQLKKGLSIAMGGLEQEGHSSGWKQMAVDSPELNRAINRKLAKFKKWDTPAGEALVCVYDSGGKQLVRKTLDSADDNFAESIRSLLLNNAPTRKDAVNKWNAAFNEAADDSRRVLVVIGDPNQKPGRLLRRWLNDHEEALEAEFVLLPLDPSFDLRFDEATKPIKGLDLVAPAIAILDSNQSVVTHSSKFGQTVDLSAQRDQGREILRQVLEEGCQKMDKAKIKRIVFGPNSR